MKPTKDSTQLPEGMQAVLDHFAPPEGQGNANFELNWTVSLLFLPLCVYFLALWHNVYVAWGLHGFAILCFANSILAMRRFRQHMGEESCPFDFVIAELLLFAQAVGHAAFAHFTFARVVSTAYEPPGLTLTNAFYYAVSVVTPLDGGGIRLAHAYPRLLAITEVCVGVWFAVSILPVALLDQAERVRHFRNTRKRMFSALSREIEDGELTLFGGSGGTPPEDPKTGRTKP